MMNICNNQTFSKLLFLFAIFVVLNLLYIKSNRQIDFVTNSIIAASVTQDDTIKQNISISNNKLNKWVKKKIFKKRQNKMHNQKELKLKKKNF